MRPFILFLLLFFLCVPAFSQDTTNQTDRLLKKITSLEEKLAELEDREVSPVATTPATSNTQTPDSKPCLDCTPELGWLWFYVLMPVILSLVVALYFLGWLKKEGFRISDAISTDVPEDRLNAFQTAMVKNGLTASSDQTSTPTPPVNRSSSRLIAFLSSLSASVLAICTFSYYMYFAIKGMKVPEFEELWPILTALGLGIVPYATKVINEKDEK